MIAVDSSALLAIALEEPEQNLFVDMVGSNRCLIGTMTALECHFVLRERAGSTGVAFIDAVMARPNVELVGFDSTLLPIARSAFDHYGRGRHPAKLNFGDCMAYAVAKYHDVPLLYKDDNFRQTDIRAALP